MPGRHAGEAAKANRSNAKLLARVRRLKGQVEAVERALEGDVELPDALMLLAAIRRATSGIATETLGRYVLEQLAGTGLDEECTRAAEEVLGGMRTYLR